MPVIIFRAASSSSPLISTGSNTNHSNNAICGWKATEPTNFPRYISADIPLSQGIGQVHNWKLKNVSWHGKNVYNVMINIPFVQHHAAHFTCVMNSYNGGSVIADPVNPNKPIIVNNNAITVYADIGQSMSTTEVVSTNGLAISQNVPLDFELGQFPLYQNHITFNIYPNNVANAAECYLCEVQIVLEYD